MGTTNHGEQNITWGYFQEATALNWGKRLLNQLPVGIYSGGYLTKVSNSQVTLGTLVAEIRDATTQINVRTTVAATLHSSTLDSGAISSATPYLVLRWSFDTVEANYVEVHAIASLASRQQNDVVIGRCVFSGATLTGFDYTDRTWPMIQDQNLRVEATSDTEMYVRVRGGIVNTGSAKVVIGDQKVGPFSVPNSPNSRIDLVYVDTDGTVKVRQGTAATSPSAPSYDGKLVLAEVRVVNGDTNITWDRITDARAFLSFPSLGSDSTAFVESWGTDDISTSLSSSWVDIPNMSLNFTTSGGLVHIVGYVPMMKWSSGLSGRYHYFRLLVDGSQKVHTALDIARYQNYIDWNLNCYTNLAAGAHTFKLQWMRGDPGVPTIYQYGSTSPRYLQVIEIK